MPNSHSNLESLFTDTANAIRAKTGSSNPIVADNFPEEISKISTGVDTSDATASASDIAEEKTAYVNGEKITGTVDVVASNQTRNSSVTRVPQILNGKLAIEAECNTDVLLRAGAGLFALSNLSDFGNAIASDVLQGKTFTSSAGLRVSGTGKAGEDVTIQQVSLTTDQSSNVTAQVITIGKFRIIFGFLSSGHFDSYGGAYINFGSYRFKDNSSVVAFAETPPSKNITVRTTVSASMLTVELDGGTGTTFGFMCVGIIN